ncbi:uncharacterized protein LOC126682290 [Mercurialis annua]|uniref:uncharacterized protein LOC126682290 n=1 Tax=Mercurialis annua TaxID=3986 RepID=UPI00216068C6|nr:uncharacterized protein LOC126682290 [Mercurialis annua]
MGEEVGSSSTASAAAISSSNIGFQLLKKHGWKEGTGLGVSEQGRLEPVQVYQKNNKRGVGAHTNNNQFKNKTAVSQSSSDHRRQNETCGLRNSKPLSKKQRKLVELEKRLQEKEFERAFYREFWPDNV